MKEFYKITYKLYIIIKIYNFGKLFLLYFLIYILKRDFSLYLK